VGLEGAENDINLSQLSCRVIFFLLARAKKSTMLLEGDLSRSKCAAPTTAGRFFECFSISFAFRNGLTCRTIVVNVAADR
jgi:hypothetical protein